MSIIIDIKEDIRIGDIILEIGDKIRVLEAIKKVYHNSPQKISSLKSEVMWFSLNKNDGLGWYEARKDEGGSSYLYEAILASSAKIANENDMTKLFKDIDLYDFISEIVSNPDHKEVMRNPGTKVLIESGYDGIVYADYDPRDSQRDLDALLVFDPKKNISNFKLIKS